MPSPRLFRTAATLALTPRCGSPLLHSRRAPPAARGLCAPPPRPLPPTLSELDLLRGGGPHGRGEAAERARVVIDAVGQRSFTVNRVRVRGSIMLFPHFATVWNVSSVAAMVPASFVALRLLHPRPDVLLLGTGRTTKPPSPELLPFFASLGVSIDPMDTDNACHTFNILNQEGRSVAAALLPAGA